MACDVDGAEDVVIESPFSRARRLAEDIVDFINENPQFQLTDALKGSSEIQQALIEALGADIALPPRSVFSYTNEEVTAKVLAEGARAYAKHKNAPQANDKEALSVLVEEVGEVATAINQNHTKAELEKEIVHVASVAFRWLAGNLTFSRLK